MRPQDPRGRVEDLVQRGRPVHVVLVSESVPCQRLPLDIDSLERMRSLQQHRPLVRLIRLLQLFLPPLLIPQWIRKQQACKPRGTDLAVQTEH